MQNAHLIYAHPSHESLNYSMYNNTKKVLTDSGFSVTTSDLYEMLRNKHPALSPYQSNSNYDTQLIEAEQHKIKSAKLTIIQFPLYWFNHPAVIQCYLEQLLTPGFAYPGKFNESPLYDGRKICLSVTTQSTENDFSAKGLNGPMNEILKPIHVAYQFVGYEILPEFVAYGVHNQSAENLTKILKDHQNHIQSIAKL